MARDRSLIEAAESLLHSQTQHSEPGHDAWHALRVRTHAMKIQKTAGGDPLLVELTALLHDVADRKFNNGDRELGPQRAQRCLLEAGASHTLATSVAAAIRAMGFEGPQELSSNLSLEQAIVRDADRIDALGAIGVARAFSFGGFCKRVMFDPELVPNLEMTREQYRDHAGPTINHFFEKLLLLKDRMLTPAGRELAEERHAILVVFVEQYLKECFACGAHDAWNRWLLTNAQRFDGFSAPLAE